MTIHHQDEENLVMTTNFKVNEFLDQADLKVFKKMEKDNPRRYLIEGIGEWGVADGLVFENWEEVAFDWREKAKGKNCELTIGLDFGYVNDPTSLVCSIVDLDNECIYVFDEHYEKHMSNKKIAEMITRKKYDKEMIIADSAEKKSIDEIKSLGANRIRPAQKGPDSIMAGIQFIQNFKIYVHPKCINFITELSMYCWVEDKTGKKLNKPVDDFNHGIDAFRYSLERFRVNKQVKVLQRPF